MFTLPELGFEFNALEPHIDAKTMEIHHDKHHATYVTKLNEALEKYPDILSKLIEDLLKDFNHLPEEVKKAVQNNGGGHHNHSLFWKALKPGGSNTPTGALAEAIDKTFGSFDELKAKMTEAGTGRFGSGWAWLVKNGDNLEVCSTANQDSPLIEGKTPVLGIDVWEHAYYLNYQNRRPDYLAAIWNVLNWDEVAKNYA